MEYFDKSLFNQAGPRSRARHAINEKHKYFVLQDHELADNMILAFQVHQTKKTYVGELVTTFVAIIITVIFPQKCL